MVAELESFGGRLKRYRKELGLTQAELAERVCCAAESIRKMEANRQRPSKLLAERLADALSLDTEERLIFMKLAQLVRRKPIAEGTPPSHSHNLSVPMTSLIGREQEVVNVCTLLRKSDVRLLTLTGPAGVGKTRLAIQVAYELLGDFPDGIFFVALASFQHPDQVIPAIAHTLQVRDGQVLTEYLKALLRTKHTLLILDNLEHLLPAAAHDIGDLLSATLSLKVLVTSRIALHLHGERQYNVPTLSVPDSRDPPTPDQLTRYDAVHLFVERARAVKPDFTVTEANAHAVAEICRRLDGLPLAIELAAAHSKMFPPPVMLTRLGTCLEFLARDAVNVPARHQTMRNAITWSYDLLNEAEQALFRRLAVFINGCTLEAAEVVCPVENEPPPDSIVTLMASLLDKSLVYVVEEPPEEPRFMMLETIREYAQERLVECGEVDTLRQQHCAYYTALMRQAAPMLEKPTRKTWMERLKREYGNLCAALEWTLEQKDGLTIVDLGGALLPFWYSYGQPGELKQWVETALAIGQNLLPANHAAGLELLGCIYADMHSDYAHAQTLYEQALALWRESGDLLSVAEVLGRLGLVAMEQGDYARSYAFHEESLNLRRRLGDPVALQGGLECLGVLLLRQGDLERARQVFSESLELGRQSDDPQSTAFALDNLGEIAFYQGDYDQARILHEQALQIWRDVGDMRGVSFSLSALGLVVLYQGYADQAQEFLNESTQLRWEWQDRDGISWNLGRLAEVAAVQEEYERAARLWGMAETLRQTLHIPLPPIERDRLERTFNGARIQLGRAAWESAVDQGRHTPIDQAVAYALQRSG